MIHTRPSLLSAGPEKTLLPRIQFFQSKGFSSSDIVKILSVCPQILHTSIENQLAPALSVMQALLPTQELVISVIKRLPKIMLSQSQDIVMPNIQILKEIRVPQSDIVWLLNNRPSTFMTSLDRFAEIVEELKGMGFNPSLRSFAVGIQAMRLMRKPKWENKFDVFKKWGWSDEETLVAFRKHPWCMICSEKKIMEMMDYYINKLGWDSSSIAKYPLLISLSLEKRVMPRCTIMQVLLSKGLIRSTSLYSTLLISEKLFLCKFVTPYDLRGRVPHLLKLNQEKLNVAKFEVKERQK